MSQLYTFIVERFESSAFRFWLSVSIAFAVNGGGILAYVLWGPTLIGELTALNLLLMGGFVLLNQEELSSRLLLFVFLLMLIGLAAEWIGVHTGLLFGEYYYTDTLGLSLWNVPLVIGLNWAIVVLGCSALSSLMLSSHVVPQRLNRKVVKLVLAATLATVFDYFLEPVAIHLNFWQWNNGVIPAFNYLSWFGVSLVGVWILLLQRVPDNKFAAILLLTQSMFFIAIRLIA
jgi:bisanhydrobacterioruberin hydratase